MTLVPEGLRRPVIIVAAPRSGSTFLFETLSRAAGFATIGGESHGVFEGVPRLRPGVGDLDSNRLTEKHLNERIRQRLYGSFEELVQDRDGRAPQAGMRLLEKTPKNALRIPFLTALFPDASFIYLYREPMANISSIMEAWRSGRFVTYHILPNWSGDWSLALPPGWMQMRGRPLAELAAFQWQAINQQVVQDLDQLERRRWIAVSYDNLAGNTRGEVTRLLDFTDMPWDEHLERYLGQPNLPLSRYTVTAPAGEKWRKNEKELMTVFGVVNPTWQEILDFTGDAGRDDALN